MLLGFSREIGVSFGECFGQAWLMSEAEEGIKRCFELRESQLSGPTHRFNFGLPDSEVFAMEADFARLIFLGVRILPGRAGTRAAPKAKESGWDVCDPRCV